MKCAVKQVAGKAIDDAKLEPDGKAGKIESKVQSYLAILDLMPGRRECAILLRTLRTITESSSADRASD
jgi:hypothetical protein